MDTAADKMQSCLVNIMDDEERVERVKMFGSFDFSAIL